MIFFYLLSGLFLGWSLGANATGNVFGAAVSTRMIRFKTAALIVSIFIFLGAVLEGSGPVGTLGRLGSVDALGGAFTVSLAAALSIFVIVRMGIPVSTSQTVVGAIIGWNFFAGKVMDFQASSPSLAPGSLPLSWRRSSLLCSSSSSEPRSTAVKYTCWCRICSSAMPS